MASPVQLRKTLLQKNCVKFVVFPLCFVCFQFSSATCLLYQAAFTKFLLSKSFFFFSHYIEQNPLIPILKEILKRKLLKEFSNTDHLHLQKPKIIKHLLNKKLFRNNLQFQFSNQLSELLLLLLVGKSF
jgi:hypothetical protein